MGKQAVLQYLFIAPFVVRGVREVGVKGTNSGMAGR